MIPDLQDGVLPEGIYPCTIEEVEAKFGKFQRSDCRPHLTQKLKQYIADACVSDMAVAVIIDGSYITKKAEPGDIDLLLVLRADFDLTLELRPFEYNLQSKRRVKKLYSFDILVALDGSEAYEQYVTLFANIRKDDPEQETSQSRKGLLRIAL